MTSVTAGKTTLVPQKCMYTYGYSLDSFFSTFFNPPPVTQNQDPDSVDGLVYNSSIVSDAFWNGSSITFESINGIFSNISSSMTTYVRAHGDEAWSDPAIGNVIVTLTCISIRWGLFAYPATLTAITLAFFVVLVVQEYRTCQGKTSSAPLDHDLKGDPLGLLFYSFNDKTSSRLNALAEREGVMTLTKEVQHTPVTLRYTAQGWKLVAEDQDRVP
jgi:hypothetical protein